MWGEFGQREIENLLGVKVPAWERTDDDEIDVKIDSQGRRIPPPNPSASSLFPRMVPQTAPPLSSRGPRSYSEAFPVGDVPSGSRRASDSAVSREQLRNLGGSGAPISQINDFVSNVRQLSDIVTPQSDFSTSISGGGDVRSFGRRKSKGSYGKGLKAKLHKYLDPKPFIWHNSFNWNTSWVSYLNHQAWACIPLNSYRGTNVYSDPVSVPKYSGVPASYNGFHNMTSKAVDYIDEIYHPNGTATNVRTNLWWFKPKEFEVDITLTNTGNIEDIVSTVPEDDPGPKFHTARNIEYEVYFYYPGHILRPHLIQGGSRPQRPK